MRKIAVIGGGVNGVCSALSLAERGCDVTIFETGKPMRQTSAKSSRMLHGGIRYLEHGRFCAVRTALLERKEWLERFPDCAEPRRFYVPLYDGARRGRFTWGAGVLLYQLLSTGQTLGMSGFHSCSAMKDAIPELRTEGLRGGVSYTDLVMNSDLLSKKLICLAEEAGVEIRGGQEVVSFNNSGKLMLKRGECFQFDHIVNAAGPWAGDLAKKNNLLRGYHLRLVAGSHIVLKYRLSVPLLMPVPWDQRVVFAIPVEDGLLVGTTEVEVDSVSEASISQNEIDYLRRVVGVYLGLDVGESQLLRSYCGVRPIVHNAGAAYGQYTQASRESVIQNIDKVTHVYGGKWTSALTLGKAVTEKVYSNI